MSQLAQRLRAAVVALIFWSVFLAVAIEVPSLSRRLVEELDSSPWNRPLAAAALLGAVILLIAPPAYRGLIGWARRRSWAPADNVIAAAVALGCLIMILQRVLLTPIVGVGWVVGLTVVLALVILLRATWTRHPSSSDSAAHHDPLFDRLLDHHGMAPLQSQGEDQLERGKLVTELYELVSRRRDISINFGIDGAWGSGKTSLLNMLSNRLRQADIKVVVFDLWSYREPERLVRVYFERLAAAIEAEAPHLQTRHMLRRLAAGLAELGGGRVAKAVGALYGDLGTEPLEVTQANLAKALITLRKPLVVILDDLDRLERDELLGLLRPLQDPQPTQMVASKPPTVWITLHRVV